MRALTIAGPGRVRLEAVDEPSWSAGQVLVAPRYVGLCGTDLELFEGTMPYFQEGVAEYPLRPGHEIAGIVASTDDPTFHVGMQVIVDPVIGCGTCGGCQSGSETLCTQRREVGIRMGWSGGLADLLVVPSSNVHRIPDEMDPAQAVFVEPGVTALHAVERLGDVQNRGALVIGGGTLGIIAAQILLARGAHVDVHEKTATRDDLIEEVGADVAPVVEPGSYELIVEAAGSPNSFRAALSAASPGGRIALTGVHAGAVDNVDVNSIVLKDLTIHGILNGPGLYGRVIQLISSGAINMEPLIDSIHPLGEAEAAFARLAETNRPRPKVLISCDGPSSVSFSHSRQLD